MEIIVLGGEKLEGAGGGGGGGGGAGRWKSGHKTWYAFIKHL